MTKRSRAIWATLLVELAPAIAAFLVPFVLRRFMADPAAACGCGEGRRKIFLGGLVLLGYSLFIFATVFLVKTAWRWV